MKNDQYHKRGFTLFEVSVAMSIAIAALLSFVPYYIKIMERGLVEQTAHRAKMVYEAAINYRLDNNGTWPGNTAVLTTNNYIPAVAATTSWGDNFVLAPAANNRLSLEFDLPNAKFVRAVAARLPAPTITITDQDNKIEEFIVPPGQEAGLQQCKVCIACSDGETWRSVVCDVANNDGWAFSNKRVCLSAGRLAIKFVCGDDIANQRYPNQVDGVGPSVDLDVHSYTYQDELSQNP